MGLFEILFIFLVVLWVVVMFAQGVNGNAIALKPKWPPAEIGVHIPGGSTKPLTSRSWLLYGDD